MDELPDSDDVKKNTVSLSRLIKVTTFGAHAQVAACHLRRKRL